MQLSLNNALMFDFTIAAAMPLGRGVACLGWTEQMDAKLKVCNLIFEDGHALSLPLDNKPSGKEPSAHFYQCAAPTFENHPAPQGFGFVLWLPNTSLSKQTPLITLNDQLAHVETLQLTSPDRIVGDEDALAAYGTVLLGLAQQHGAKALHKLLTQEIDTLVQQRSDALGRVDQAWNVADQLLIMGQLACRPSQLKSAWLKSGRTRVDVSTLIEVHPLATAWDKKGNPLQCERSAFVLVLPQQSKASKNSPLLQLDMLGVGPLEFDVQALHCEVNALGSILNQQPALAMPVLNLLQKQLKTTALRKQLSLLRRECFLQQWPNINSATRFADVAAAGVGSAFALEEEGLLVIGTLIHPEGTPLQAWLYADDHAPVDVSKKLCFMPTSDRANIFRQSFPQAGDHAAFLLHVPIATKGAEARALRIMLPDLPELWIKVETPALQQRGVDVARMMLSDLPATDYLRRNFKDIFDQGLGRAMHWVAAQLPSSNTAVTEAQFGIAPTKPRMSVIIPLYGRCDFMRHQLAQFCDDPDFKQVDLIYVVDDPALHTATLDLAGQYHALFGVAFRVVTYPENRGFAGANNTAAALAKAPLLVLMNSDVLPQHNGWLSSLQKALKRLPECAMVGPLLQFPEGSVQHAGMAAIRQTANPGMIFSHHPGKGCAWEGDNKPSEQVMLTGACLMLSKSDYLQAGGLDESYIVGDFEDSDLSLRLRSFGKRLYLVPAAKLWHLERQSQYLGDNKISVRDMLTMYNAWRYQKKIVDGLLPDPEKIKFNTKTKPKLKAKTKAKASKKTKSKRKVQS